MSGYWTCAWALSLTLLASSCGAPVSGNAAETAETQSFVSTGKLWPNPRAIPVCLVNPESVQESFVSDLRDAVNSVYRTQTGAGFVGWLKCGAPQGHWIRLRFEIDSLVGEGLSVLGLSPQLSRSRNGAVHGGLSRAPDATMLLHLRGSNWPDAELSQLTHDWVRRTVTGVAMHEFGHALGLEHEHQRDDRGKFTPANCPFFDGESPDPILRTGFWGWWRRKKVGSYDPFSIMNYCHPDWTDRKYEARLSAGDVAGIRFLYPSLR